MRSVITRGRVLAALAVVAISIFAFYVWPTPYRYFTIYEPLTRPARVQRFTGSTQLLGRWGWYSVPRPVPQTTLYQEYDSLRRVGALDTSSSP